MWNCLNLPGWIISFGKLFHSLTVARKTILMYIYYIAIPLGYTKWCMVFMFYPLVCTVIVLNKTSSLGKSSATDIDVLFYKTLASSLEFSLSYEQ